MTADWIMLGGWLMGAGSALLAVGVAGVLGNVSLSGYYYDR